MRNRGFLLICVFIFATWGVSFSAEAEGVPVLDFSHVLEDFNSGTQVRDWKAKGSRFIRSGYPRVAYTDVYPKAIESSIPDDKKSSQRVMGVNAEWSKKGRNYVDIIPCELGTTNYLPIEFEGAVDSIDLWVWGANYNYYLDVVLEDWHGVSHRLPICTLDFVGWQPKKVRIPHWIPQTVKYLPHSKPLKLTKFVITTFRDERIDSFYVYFDEIKYLTNNYHDPFDGEALIDRDKIAEIWGSDNGSGK